MVAHKILRCGRGENGIFIRCGKIGKNKEKREHLALFVI